MDSEYNLNRYLNIEAYIRKLEQEKRLIRQELYCQSLCTGIAYDEIAIHAKAPKIDYLVADNVEACMLIDKRIERWKFRHKHFMHFLDELPVTERESLLKGVESPSLKQRALDEIYEIETAMAFRYEWEVPQEKVELTDDLFSNIALMAEVFG